jgi:Family of unknown function (DUF5706)
MRNDSSEPTDLKDVASFAQYVHGFLNGSIDFADKKAAAVSGALTALVAFLKVQKGKHFWLSPELGWSTILIVVMDIGLSGGILLSLLVVMPRYVVSKKGKIFWEGILDFGSARKYSDAVLRSGSEELARGQLEDCYDLARILTRKHRVLRIAIAFGAAGLIASILYMVLY